MGTRIQWPVFADDAGSPRSSGESSVESASESSEESAASWPSAQSAPRIRRVSISEEHEVHLIESHAEFHVEVGLPPEPFTESDDEDGAAPSALLCSAENRRAKRCASSTGRGVVPATLPKPSSSSLYNRRFQARTATT